MNGLSATDLRRPAMGAGFLLRFANRVRQLYALEGVKSTGLAYEPRVAHQAMRELLYETPNITLYRRTRLAKVKTGALMDGSDRKPVTSIIVDELDASSLATGRSVEIKAKVFIDATDCGDLAAWAGAPFRTGREARSLEEPHNGVVYYERYVERFLPGSTGEADNRIQAYSYLLTVHDYGKGAYKLIVPPTDYRKEKYEHAPTWKESLRACHFVELPPLKKLKPQNMQSSRRLKK